LSGILAHAACVENHIGISSRRIRHHGGGRAIQNASLIARIVGRVCERRHMPAVQIEAEGLDDRRSLAAHQHQSIRRRVVAASARHEQSGKNKTHEPEQPKSFRHSLRHLHFEVSFARADAPGTRRPGCCSLKCGKSQPICVSGKRRKSNLPARWLEPQAAAWSCLHGRKLAATQMFLPS